VAEYVAEPERVRLKFRLRAAYAIPEAVDARRALYQLHDELMRSHPSAADSLAEGLEETLTLQELGIRETAAFLLQHQHYRIRLRHRRAGLHASEALAGRRSPLALGRFRFGLC